MSRGVICAVRAASLRGSEMPLADINCSEYTAANGRRVRRYWGTLSVLLVKSSCVLAIVYTYVYKKKLITDITYMDKIQRYTDNKQI